MINLKSQKGELTTQQIVMIVIAITSFAIILFLLFRLNVGQLTEEELCYNSVVMRGSAITPTEATPLKCHRKYVCVTEDGSCEGLTNPEIVEVKSLKEVNTYLADEMARCWKMFGEGRINYVGDDVTHNNYCSICSQILLDNSLNKIEGVQEKISKDELYSYLQNNKFDDKNTYSEYLFGGKDLNLLKQESQDVKTFGNLEIGKQYFVVMGITSEVGLWNWVGLGAVTGGIIDVGGVVISTLVFGTNPLGWVSGLTVIGVSAVVGGLASEISEGDNLEIAAIILDGRGIDNKFMAPTIIEANSEKFKALNCEEVLTLA